MTVTTRRGANGHSNSIDPTNTQVEDVVIAGAGPAGLMLASNLVRFGIKPVIIDDRTGQTPTGRADGLQPKTIETFRQMRLADSLLQKGVRIYDMSFWNSTASQKLKRTGRQVHYPPEVNAQDPFILVGHQGMVEEIFLDDIKKRDVDVTRSSPFIGHTIDLSNMQHISVHYDDKSKGLKRTVKTKYLVGCDGAHSQVRKSTSEFRMEGESTNASWGVLDGIIETDFPDIWTKVILHSETAGAMLSIPRERNMTRLYIELTKGVEGSLGSEDVTQEAVMNQASRIMSPYKVKWQSVDWFSVYRVGQRVANKFMDDSQKIFIAGDASHTHSPKAAQGMNTSMHDTFNLGWKLNLVLRGLSGPPLLATYEDERRKIALDLIKFDFEHHNAFMAGDSDSLAQNFTENIAFISGVGVKYNANILNMPEKTLSKGKLRAGELLPPSQVLRYIDSNPVDIQLDIPFLGQFRIYMFVPNIIRASKFLDHFCTSISAPGSIMQQATNAAAKSYAKQFALAIEDDEFIQPRRYTACSHLFTFATVTTMNQSDVEIADLPPLLQKSAWTFYSDTLSGKDQGCTQSWLGGLEDQEIAIVNVRPDGYVGSVGRFTIDHEDEDIKATKWLENYYGGFLQVQ